MFEKLIRNPRKELMSKIENLKRELREKDKLISDIRAKLDFQETNRKHLETFQKEKGQSEVLRTIQQLSYLDLDKLREEECAFDVYEVSKEGKSQMWAVVTGYCQYGGCDIPTFFGNELFARIYAITLTKLGREPTSIGICPECQAEYLENSV